MTKENEFLVSVSEVKYFEPQTNNLILNGKTKLDASMQQQMQSQLINAGKGSKGIYEYNYQKELTFKITEATFDMKYLAMQNGTSILRELGDYFADEFITLDSTGKGTLPNTPFGTVHVQASNGEYVQVVANGNEFTYPALADKEVNVVYVYKEVMDTVKITGDAFPKAVKMVMNADINTRNGKVGEMQIIVPQFKPDGALELSMTHDGVSSTPMSGRALADNKGVYAIISIKRFDQDTVEVHSLYVDKPELTLEAGLTPADSELVTVYGQRGGLYGTIKLDNTGLTFTSDNATIATVNASGVITLAGSANAGDVVMVRVADTAGNRDTVEVTVV
ncbi:hypothetical protein [Metasolibacillus meyeri]|uniref:hypothetical protein n=1 Tax=Metasolibacillus meyeri TaxID=1071052 RepID=UPI000D2F64EE|nr:hypothetical protein [Metasolibacillus meyeri]